MKSETLTLAERDAWWWVVHPRDAAVMTGAVVTGAVAATIGASPIAVIGALVAVGAPWRIGGLSLARWVATVGAYWSRQREMTVRTVSDGWVCRGGRPTRWRAVSRVGVPGENHDVVAHHQLRTVMHDGGWWRVHYGATISEWVSDPTGDFSALSDFDGRYRESWRSLRRHGEVWVTGRVRAVNARSDVWRALASSRLPLVAVMEVEPIAPAVAQRALRRLAHRAEVEERWRLRHGFDAGTRRDTWMSIVMRRRDAIIQGDGALEVTLTVMASGATRREVERQWDELSSLAQRHGLVIERGDGRHALWFAESGGPRG